MTKKFVRTLILTIVFTSVLTGCNLPFRQTPIEIPPTQELNLLATLTQQAIELDVQETLTAPTPEPTLPVTLTPIPLVTFNPTATFQEFPANEVKFSGGGTIDYYQRDIKAREEHVFLIEAGAGQNLIVVASSEGDQVYFKIESLEDGFVFVPYTDEVSSVRIPLPQTAIYQITLTSPGNSRYFLSFEVPAVLPVSPGTNLLQVEGYLDVLDDFHPASPTRVRYLMQLQAGSVLNVRLASPALEGFALALIGADDGQPFLRHEVQSTFIDNFSVPKSQGYYLDVYSLSGKSAEFSLQVDVGE